MSSLVLVLRWFSHTGTVLLDNVLHLQEMCTKYLGLVFYTNLTILVQEVLQNIEFFKLFGDVALSQFLLKKIILYKLLTLAQHNMSDSLHCIRSAPIKCPHARLNCEKKAKVNLFNHGVHFFSLFPLSFHYYRFHI